MKLIKMECEHCGAALEMDMEHMEACCPYCGSKLMIDVDHFDHIVESVEETKREQIKEDGRVKRSEMEFAYKNKVNNQAQKFIKYFMIFFGAIFCLIFVIIIISFIRMSFFF